LFRCEKAEPCTNFLAYPEMAILSAGPLLVRVGRLKLPGWLTIDSKDIPPDVWNIGNVFCAPTHIFHILSESGVEIGQTVRCCGN
jgi:hypothetical protein